MGCTTKCVEKLTKLCLDHSNEVYIGKIDDKIRFVPVDTVWSDQQHFLSKGMSEAIWLKNYYESMYSTLDEQKRLLCAVIEINGICIDCKTWSIPKDVAYKIFSKWRIIGALMTDVFKIFLKKYYGFSLDT